MLYTMSTIKLSQQSYNIINGWSSTIKGILKAPNNPAILEVDVSEVKVSEIHVTKSNIYHGGSYDTYVLCYHKVYVAKDIWEGKISYKYIVLCLIINYYFMCSSNYYHYFFQVHDMPLKCINKWNKIIIQGSEIIDTTTTTMFNIINYGLLTTFIERWNAEMSRKGVCSCR